MRSHRIALTFAAVMAAFAGASAHAATEIQFWHSMEGALGDRVNGLVDEFNKKNPEYQVKAVYKGNYGESMNAGIAAFRAGNAPDILQVFEVGTATMMYAKGAIKPVQQMSEEAGNPIDPKEFIGAVAGYYSSADGKLVSMPFNSSTVVFYYNKDAFKKAGLTPTSRPRPGRAAAAGQKLKAAGQECGYTTSWPSWVQLETLGLAQRALRHQGQRLRRLDARVAVNTRRTCATWKTWPSWAGRHSSVRSRRRAELAVHQRQVRHDHRIVGPARQHRQERQAEFGTSTLPYYSDAGRAAEHHHRRRLAVGLRQQEAGNARRVTASSSSWPAPRSPPAGTSRPATCPSPRLPTS